MLSDDEREAFEAGDSVTLESGETLQKLPPLP